MTKYCQEAAQYGDLTQPAGQPFNKVLVLLNPTADKRSAAKTVSIILNNCNIECQSNVYILLQYSAYCEPILHLAGVKVDVVKTDSEGHARRYIEELETLPDAILVAGGDGTVSETVSGLLRRGNPKEKAPSIGILPVGRANNIATTIFSYANGSDLEEVRGIADATIAVVRGKTQRKHVMQIQLLPTEENPQQPKPVYAVGRLQWGAYRDAFEKRDRYWYLGALREHATFLFNAFSDSLTWNCKATVIYTEPCLGCSNCYVKPNSTQPTRNQRRWWSGFIPSFRLGGGAANGDLPDRSKVVNKNCANTTVIEVQPSEILLATENDVDGDRSDTSVPKISLKLGNGCEGFEFAQESWKRLHRNQFEPLIEYSARSVVIHPHIEITPENEKFFSIDSEAYELHPVQVTLIPNAINVYVP